eukprot:117458_1
MATNEEAPPPFQENATKADGGENDKGKTDNADGGGDGGDVPSGSGLFGSPRNRAFALGGALIFWCILSIWWWAYGLDANSDLNDACEGLDNDYCDTVTTWLAGYALIVLAIILIGVGAIIAIIGALQGGNRCFGIIALILEAAGSLFLMLGYFCIVGGTANYYDLFNVEMSDIEAGFYTGLFGEFAIVCGTALVLGIDSFMVGFFNDDKKRALGMSGVVFVLFGIIAGAGYAIVSSEYGDLSTIYNTMPEDEYGCIAAGFFIMAIGSIIRLLIDLGVVNTGINPITNATVGMLLASLIIIGGLVCAAGYWALVDWYDQFDIDDDSSSAWGGDSTYSWSYGSYYDWNTRRRLQTSQSTTNPDSLDQWRCFLMGQSFFILILAVVNGLDMGLIDKCKVAAAAGAASGAATN